MKLSQRGLDLICSFEGYHTALPDGSCKAYLDTLAKPHVWTIGYGVTEGVTAGMVLSKNEAQAMFARELEKHEAIVTRLVTVEIGQNNFDALVSFSYNTGGLAGSTLLRKLNARDFDGAAKEFARWNKAGGKVWKGLVRRRAAERALFEMDARDEEIPDGEPDMPQAVEPSPQKPSRPAIAVASTVAAGSVSTAVQNAPDATTVTKLIGCDSLVSCGGSFGVFAGTKPVFLAAVALGLTAIWFGPWLLSKIRGTA